jgi:hypothetical protein
VDYKIRESKESMLTFAGHVARMIFAKRGNHSEAHLTEVELQTIIAASIEKWVEVSK